MSHRLKSQDNYEGLAGVAALPHASSVNGCDGAEAWNNPSETAANPRLCLTFSDWFVAYVAAYWAADFIRYGDAISLILCLLLGFSVAKFGGRRA